MATTERDWTDTLRAFVRGRGHAREDEAAEEAKVRRHMVEIYQQRQERLAATRPAATAIPRFYFHKASSEAQQRLYHLARTHFFERKHDELLDDRDVEELAARLEDFRDRPEVGKWCIDYDQFTQLGGLLSPRFSIVFRPEVFMKFPRDSAGCISCNALYDFVCRLAGYWHTRHQLSSFDSNGKGYLEEADLENYISFLIPSLPPLRDLQQNFVAYYVFTAVRKFFFFLDPKRKGHISILTLSTSGILSELLELGVDPATRANWFTPHNAMRVYTQYLELDEDQNGMLSKTELLRYGPGRLTKAFVDRVFEECRVYDGEMDYKTYLDFVLAMENKNTPQALAYFFRILDVRKQGALTNFSIAFFFREVAALMFPPGSEDAVRVADVIDEIFDMVKPEDPLHITARDLVRCGVGGTVVNMLIDLKGFWDYDNRENMMQEPEEDHGS